MPLKSGALTMGERRVAAAYAASGDQGYTAHKSGMKQSGVSLALQRPAVQSEIARIQTERLFSEALPAAVDCLVSLIKSDKAPAGARVQAAKVVIDRTLGSSEAGNGKEAHEMSGAELARAISELEQEASGRALNITPVQPAESDVFE